MSNAGVESVYEWKGEVRTIDFIFHIFLVLVTVLVDKWLKEMHH